MIGLVMCKNVIFSCFSHCSFTQLIGMITYQQINMIK